MSVMAKVEKAREMVDFAASNRVLAAKLDSDRDKLLETAAMLASHSEALLAAAETYEEWAKTLDEPNDDGYD